MQQQSNGRSSATGMEPAGAVHVDAAEVAAAAAELLAESPESPKAVPVGRRCHWFSYKTLFKTE